MGVGRTREVVGAKKEGKHVNLEDLWSFVLRTGITSFLVYSVHVEKNSVNTCQSMT